MAFYCAESPLDQQGKTMMRMCHETLKSVDSWNMPLAIFLKECRTFNVRTYVGGKENVFREVIMCNRVLLAV